MVQPGDQEARDAGLRPGLLLYRAAVWWLLDVGALVPDEEANEWLRNAVGAQHRGFAFKITRRGLNMLRRVRKPAGKQLVAQRVPGMNTVAGVSWT